MQKLREGKVRSEKSSVKSSGKLEVNRSDY